MRATKLFCECNNFYLTFNFRKTNNLICECIRPPKFRKEFSKKTEQIKPLNEKNLNVKMSSENSEKKCEEKDANSMSMSYF